jgi:hypothetical protein
MVLPHHELQLKIWSEYPSWGNLARTLRILLFSKTRSHTRDSILPQSNDFIPGLAPGNYRKPNLGTKWVHARCLPNFKVSWRLRSLKKDLKWISVLRKFSSHSSNPVVQQNKKPYQRFSNGSTTSWIAVKDICYPSLIITLRQYRISGMASTID